MAAHLSVTDAGGDGSLSYNNSTGAFTYTGPSAAEVRKDVLSQINFVNINMWDPYKKEKDKIINDALMKVIPDTRNDFVSWRGYSSFGVKNDLTKEVLPIIQ